MTIVRALGLMSGTSLDGVDVAVIETDGAAQTQALAGLTLPYPEAFKARLRTAVLTGTADAALIRDLTLAHANAARQLLQQHGRALGEITVVGFHGHTLWHKPQQRATKQIGDGDYLSKLLDLPVVADFRSHDVAMGGQGAPLVPLYHAGRLQHETKPVAVLNIGGVANVTYLPTQGAPIAFDTGPGGALLDDWMLQHTGIAQDEGGRVAASGVVLPKVVAAVLNDRYFRRPPPKSLDRQDFHDMVMHKLREASASLSQGAATLCRLTAETVAAGLPFFPEPARVWYVTGGGRHNQTMMGMLRDVLGVPVRPVEDLSWQGDFLEAEAFAYLAVRALRRLPLSLPSTTGVSRPTLGGKLYLPLAA